MTDDDAMMLDVHRWQDCVLCRTTIRLRVLMSLVLAV